TTAPEQTAAPIAAPGTLIANACPTPATASIPRQFASERLGGTIAGGNQPASGSTSDHSTPTISGMINTTDATVKNPRASIQRPGAPRMIQDRFIAARPPGAGSTGNTHRAGPPTAP